MHLCIFIQPELLAGGVGPCFTERAELVAVHGINDHLVIYHDAIREPFRSNVLEEGVEAFLFRRAFKVIRKARAAAFYGKAVLRNVAPFVVCRVTFFADLAG